MQLAEVYIFNSNAFPLGMEDGQFFWSPSKKYSDDYYPFGLAMPGRSSNSANPNDNYKFTGHELDDEAGLGIYHMNARGMDPVLGRMMQIDPLASMFPGWSSYSYAFNNPMGYTDPTGMAPMSTHTDSLGNVVSVYDDGDTGVYSHTGSASEIQAKTDACNASGDTSCGGNNVGHTLHVNSFAVGDQIDLNGDNTGGQLIDHYSSLAAGMSLLGYFNNARDGGTLDVKSHTNVGGYVKGESGLIVSSRDVGNIVAGGVAGNYPLLTPNILAAYGEFNVRRGLVGGRMTDAAVSATLGLGTSLISQPTSLQMYMFLKEDAVSVKGIMYGLSRK